MSGQQHAGAWVVANERATAAEAEARRVCDILDERSNIPVDAGTLAERVVLLQHLREMAEAEAARLLRLLDDSNAMLGRATEQLAAVQEAARAVTAWEWQHGDDCPHRYCAQSDCDGGRDFDDCESPGGECDCAVVLVERLRDALATEPKTAKG